ncbi:MAG: hypothetical protein ABI793_12300, partial [Flavobacterium sp.]
MKKIILLLMLALTAFLSQAQTATLKAGDAAPDFKLKNVTKTQDSITFTIKNKRHKTMPISLFTLNNDSIISKRW